MAKNTRFWYVFNLEVQSDPNAVIFAQVQGEPVAQAAPARNNRGLRLDVNGVDGVAGGYGFKIHGTTHRNMNLAFTSKQAARTYAKEQAEKNPKTMYGIYECCEVFETTTPTIIEKKFNDANELIPVV